LSRIEQVSDKQLQLQPGRRGRESPTAATRLPPRTSPRDAKNRPAVHLWAQALLPPPVLPLPPHWPAATAGVLSHGETRDREGSGRRFARRRGC